MPVLGHGICETILHSTLEGNPPAAPTYLLDILRDKKLTQQQNFKSVDYKLNLILDIQAHFLLKPH